MTYAEIFLLVWCGVATMLAVMYRAAACKYFERSHSVVLFVARMFNDKEFFDKAKADFDTMGQIRIQIRGD